MLGPLRDVSIIILVCQGMLCLIIPLALMGGLAYVSYRTHRALPSKFQLVQTQAQRMNKGVDQAGAKIISSLAAAEAKYTRTETLLRGLFRSTKKDQS